METSNMKNMVILKNLPSNLVEEAIVILKSSKKVEKLEKIDKNNKLDKKVDGVKKEKDYILKEAEMLVSSYISKIENNQEHKQSKVVKSYKKYVRLKIYAYLSSIIIFIEAMLIVIK